KKPVVDLPLQSVKELLEGPLGSSVEIEIQRPGEPAPQAPITIMRARAVVASVDHYEVLNTPYYHIKINSFTETTLQSLDEAIAEMAKKEYKGLILDLRENNGGLFESSIETARRFLSTGIITSTLHQDPKYNQVYHARNQKALTLPMVVLVDGDTASAAEVLAGAL